MSTSNYPSLDPNASGVNYAQGPNSSFSSAPGNSFDSPSGGSTANGSSVENAKNAAVTNAQTAMDKVANHPVTQNITQGPVADKAREHYDATSTEFSNVAASRRVPDQPAATGQPLTHYHSMFYNILSWQNPRVSAIAYVSIVTALFVTRYVPILRLALKGTYIILGVIAAAELAGKLIFDRGIATQMRPRKYYTIPRENLERSLEDVEQLINFFVIEFQRILFAENIYATIGAFASALIFYFIQKVTPLWGVGLIATSVIFLAPLIYIQNREFIDQHLNNAGNVINAQASQARDLAGHHAGRAGEVAKSTVNQYTAKAQGMMGQAKNKSASSDAPNPANLNPYKNEPERSINNSASSDAPNPANLNPYKNDPERSISKEDFPNAPSTGERSFDRSDFPSAPRTELSGLEHGGVSATEPQAQPGQSLPSQSSYGQSSYGQPLAGLSGQSGQTLPGQQYAQ